LYRKPVVLEYKVPVEKVEAYLPAVFNSIDEAGDGFNNLARMNVENSYSHLADDLVDEGYDYYDALDELKGNYGFDDIYDSIDTANKESEVLIDLTDIKPNNIFSDFSEVNQMVDLNILDRLKFAQGGPTNIQDMLDDINKNLGIDEVELDIGSIEPVKPLYIGKPVGSEGFEKTLLSLGTRGISDVLGSDDNMQSIIFYMMARRLPSAERAKLFIDPLKKKIAKLEKDKKKYIETHQAKNVDKYKQKLNSFDKEIKKLEKNIKENKISYDLEDL